MSSTNLIFTAMSIAKERCQCGKERRKGQRYCLKCHREYMAKWRAKHKIRLQKEEHFRRLAEAM